MDEKKLTDILDKIRDGSLEVGEAVKKFKNFAFEDIDYAKIDHHRSLRKGYAEVIYSENKSAAQICGIIKSLAQNNTNILATRLSREKFDIIRGEYADAVYNEAARTMRMINVPVEEKDITVAIVTAGTSDIPVAEEAAETVRINGYKAVTIYDVGVAGIHRLFANLEKIRESDVVITVAGMEGALASVIGGLIDSPMIAVPTSVGYGASFGGLSALLTMLNSCAGGVCVVNIDNGFGAGYAACMIARKIQEKRK